MEDKLINILGRYIQYSYPELLRGNLRININTMSELHSMISDNCYIMISDNCYIGEIVRYSGDITSIYIIDRYHSSLKTIFGDEYKELLRKWFNREHENMLYSLLGDDCGVVFINV